MQRAQRAARLQRLEQMDAAAAADAGVAAQPEHLQAAVAAAEGVREGVGGARGEPRVTDGDAAASGAAQREATQPGCRVAQAERDEPGALVGDGTAEPQLPQARARRQRRGQPGGTRVADVAREAEHSQLAGLPPLAAPAVEGRRTRGCARVTGVRAGEVQQVERGRGQEGAAKDGGAGVGQRVGREVDIGEARQGEQGVGQHEAQLRRALLLPTDAQPRRERRPGRRLELQRDLVAVEGEGGEGRRAAAPHEAGKGARRLVAKAAG